MSGYSETLSPDGLSGIIFALEGVDHALVLLNGPTGCKFYHSATSDSQVIRQLEFDPLNFPPVWYFGQPRVPCTYLDNSDYVYGSEAKISEALEYLRDNVSYDLIALVNSPGAALIGDDLEGIARRVLTDDAPLVTIETPGYSTDVCQGHEDGMIALFERFANQPGTKAGPRPSHRAACDRPLVNVLGLTLFQRNHRGDVAELRRLLELCDIEVNSFLGGGGTLQQLRHVADAQLNVVVHPEFGLRSASWLHEHLGTPSYICEGVPIGFSATERMLVDICDALGADPAPALEESKRARALAYAFISRVNSLTGLPKCVRYAAEGSCSELLGYVGFMTGYLGMVADCLRTCYPQSDCMADAVRSKVADLGMDDAFVRAMCDTRASIVLGSGNTIASLKLANREFCGIETMLPTLGYYDVIPKTHLGIKGALQLVELVLNALPF